MNIIVALKKSYKYLYLKDNLDFCNLDEQRWSRGQKARGPGQGHKKIRYQGQPFRGQTLSRPRTGLLEAKDTSASAPPPKKKGPHKNF